MMRAPVLAAVLLFVLAGCRQPEPRDAPAPPPSAERPVIKTQAELEAERAERIRLGQVQPTSAPVFLGESRATAPRRTPPALTPQPGAIEGDILMVDRDALTAAEIVYTLRDEIAELRRTQTPAGFQERVRQLIRRETQREIGAMLIYAEATAKFEENQKEALEKAIDREMDNTAAREFGASTSRFDAHLASWNLTRAQYRAALKRDLLVRQYTREKLMPQIAVRRDELLTFYQRNRAQYQTPETRELLLIEIAFARLLPEGTSWDAADRSTRAQAKLAAVERIREAQAALAERPFEEVAREFSHDLHAADGGSWGLIGRPLQAPYDEVSARIFRMNAGEVSEPIETERGWYLVKCGQVNVATEQAFADVQNEIRRELMERRFQRLSAEYVIKLASNATISSLDLFVNAAVERAEYAPVSRD